MDIGLLKIFQAVAREQSVSKAARRLGYVQSNVTARVQQLEDELAVMLFYRKQRGMHLTPAGRTLLEYANQILHLVTTAHEAVQDTEQMRGTILLGSMESTAAVHLPELLTQYHRAYPEVEIVLTTGTTAELITKTLHYELDGAFVAGQMAHTAIEQVPIFDEELVFATERTIETLDALAHPTLLVFRQGCTYRTHLEQVLRTWGPAPRKIMEFGSLEAILGCVAAGMGITMFPRSTIAKLHYTDKVKLHPLPAAAARVPTMFIQRNDTVRTRALAAFVAIAQQRDTETGSGLTR